MDPISLLSVRQRVLVGGVLLGTIVGHGTELKNVPSIKYHVELDKGFYTDDKTIYVKTIVVDPTSVKVVG